MFIPRFQFGHGNLVKSHGKVLEIHWSKCVRTLSVIFLNILQHNKTFFFFYWLTLFSPFRLRCAAPLHTSVTYIFTHWWHCDTWPLPEVNNCDRQLPQVLSRRRMCCHSRWGGGARNCPLQLSVILCLRRGNKSTLCNWFN